MIEHPSVIPITVVTAIVVFLIKELLEAIRRCKADSRKLDAIRRFLAVECERNYFSIERLTDQIKKVSTALNQGSEISIERRQRGMTLLTITDGTKGYGRSPVQKIHLTLLEKYLFDAASLDSKLFDVMFDALEKLIEVAHVRDSLIEYVDEDREHIDGFSDYAFEVIKNADVSLHTLYSKCTGKPLTKGRVR